MSIECRHCGGLRFIVGWGHGPKVWCLKHAHIGRAAKWFRTVTWRLTQKERERVQEEKSQRRLARIERRRLARESESSAR